jgi:MFS family permease
MSAAIASLDGAQDLVSRSSLRGLDGVNFFLAALLVAFGPYVAAYLAEQRWTQAEIGFILTVSSVAGLLFQVPNGELLDKIRSKRLVVAVATSVIALSAAIIALRPSFTFASVGLVLQGVTGGLLAPALAAISLGLVGHSALPDRLGRNQRFASIGALVGAALMGLAGYFLSYQAILLTAAALGLPLLFALSRIRATDIHFGRSFGAPGHEANEKPKRIDRWALWQNDRLRVFALCLFLFQLANASLLPLASEMLVRKSAPTSSLIVSAMIIVPQIVVALAAPWTGRLAKSWGRRPLLLIGFAVLPVRALAFALTSDPRVLVAIQALDGVSATVLGVLTALVVADITIGTGRFNLAQGIVGTASGFGASISTILSGAIAQRLGFGSGFLFVAITALLATLVVLFLMPETRPQTVASHADGSETVANNEADHSI